jgi:hypothetical protein
VHGSSSASPSLVAQAVDAAHGAARGLASTAA